MKVLNLYSHTEFQQMFISFFSLGQSINASSVKLGYKSHSLKRQNSRNNCCTLPMLGIIIIPLFLDTLTVYYSSFRDI